MPDPRWNDLFDRYRTHGDVDALARLFDEVGPSLLKVARHVDSRRGEPEDLVQTTFLVAIERAATYDMTRPLVPWMMGILINQSRIARRRRKEVVDGGEHENSSESTQHSDVESSELTKAVTKALSELPETYREVLIAHLQEGKKPRDIARELGRPQGTVRAQLHRGLRLMRNLLPASLSLGFLALLAPNSLATIRRNVLLEARRRAVPSGDESTAKLATQSATSVSGVQILALVLFVGLAGLLGWSLFGTGGERVIVESGSGVEADVDAVARADLEVPVESNDLVPHRSVRILPTEAAPTLENPLQGGVVVRVERLGRGDPVAGALVELVAWGSERWFDEVRTARTRADGSALFLGVAPGRAGVHVERGEQSRIEIVAGRTLELAVVIHADCQLSGRVVDERGLPIEGADVALQLADGGRAPVATVNSGSDGRFRVAGADPAWLLGATKAGFAPSALRSIDGPTLPERAEFVLVLDGRVRSLRGRVLGEDGTPVAGALVRAGAPRTDARRASVRWRDDGHVERDAPPVEAATSSSGEFALEGLALGGLSLEVVHADWLPWRVGLAPAEGGARFERIDVRLERGATIEGHLTVAGRPVQGEVGVDGSELRVRANAEGEYRLRVPAGGVLLLARLDRFTEPIQRRFELATGTSARFDAELTPTPTIQGTVRGVDGRPIAGMLVRCTPQSDASEARFAAGGPWASIVGESDDLVQACTDRDGRFVLPAYHGRVHSIEARRRAHWRGPVQARVEGVTAGATGVTLVTGARTAWLTGRVLDADGRIARGTLYESSASRVDAARGELDPATGAFRIGPLFAGEHRLRLCVRGAPPIDLGTFQAVERTETDVGALASPRTGSVELRGSGPFAVLGEDGIERRLEEMEGGLWRAVRVPLGNYSVLADARATGKVIQVEAGDVVRLELE